MHCATTREIQDLPETFLGSDDRFEDGQHRVTCDYLEILVAYLNRVPAVKEALTMGRNGYVEFRLEVKVF